MTIGPLLSTLLLLVACVRWPLGRDLVYDDPASRGFPTSRTLAANVAQLHADLPDFVFVGTVSFIRPEPPSEMGGSLATIGYRVESLVKGVCRDTLVRLTGRMPSFSWAVFHPGSRVLVAGAHGGKGAWPMDVQVVDSSGVLLRDRQNSDDERDLRENPDELRVQDLLEAMQPLPDIHTVLNGAVGLATAEPFIVQRLPGGGWVASADKAKWIVPGRGEPPRYIRFDCANLVPHISLLLLPVPAGARGDTLTLPCHPVRLRIENGRLPGLDVPLDSLPRLVRRGRDGTLRLD